MFLFSSSPCVHTCIRNLHTYSLSSTFPPHTHTHPFPPHTHTLFPPPSHPHTAYLTHESVELQELAANSDRLIASLVEYLQERPDENDDLVQEKHFTMFDNLREVCVYVCVWGGGEIGGEALMRQMVYMFQSSLPPSLPPSLSPSLPPSLPPSLFLFFFFSFVCIHTHT